MFGVGTDNNEPIYFQLLSGFLQFLRQSRGTSIQSKRSSTGRYTRRTAVLFNCYCYCIYMFNTLISHPFYRVYKYI